MPGLDKTGPMGQGAMTGRGMGNCQGSQQNLGVGFGRGIGLGRGNRMGYGYGMNNARGFSCGRGFGFRANFNNSNIAPLQQDELSLLKSQATILENTLNSVNSRISNLEEK